MTDVQATQPEWDRFLGREQALVFLAAARLLREVRDRFRLQRTQTFLTRDTSSYLGAGGVTLAGVNPGVNCTPAGGVFPRITGAGPFTVNLYRAAGAGGADLIATGSGAANTTVALAESNDSGISGTWSLPAAPAATIADELFMLASVDFPGLLHTVFNEDGTVDDDRFSRAAAEDSYSRVEALISDAIDDVMNQGLSEFAISGQDNVQARGNAFLRASDNTLQTDEEDEDDGNIRRVRTGYFESLRLSMEEETVAGEQFVVRREIQAAAAVFEASNSGQGSVSAHTPGEQCPIATFVFTCDSAEIGEESFAGSVTFKQGGLEQTVELQGLQVGKEFNGPLGFGPVMLNRLYSKTNDAGDTILAGASAVSVTGESSTNTDDGKLYVETELSGGVGPGIDISFYSDSSLTNLVAKAVNVAAGAAFTASSQGSSGLSVSWDAGAAPAASANIVLDLHPFKLQNSNGVPDRFSITTTLVGTPGLIQEILAEEVLNGARLNSAAAGSETISDDWAKHGTFPDFTVQDN